MRGTQVRCHRVPQGRPPIRGWRLYPTADGTARCLKDRIAAYPGVSELELERPFMPNGGVPDWLETDIQRLLSEGRISQKTEGFEDPVTWALVMVRTFFPVGGCQP